METKRKLKERPNASKPLTRREVLAFSVLGLLLLVFFVLGQLYPDRGIIGFLFGGGRFLIFCYLVALVCFIFGLRTKKTRTVGVESAILIAKEGEVVQRCNPVGMVRVGSELWKAQSMDGSRIEVGQRVTVCGVQGLTLVVAAQSKAGERSERLDGSVGL